MKLLLTCCKTLFLTSILVTTCKILKCKIFLFLAPNSSYRNLSAKSSSSWLWILHNFFALRFAKFSYSWLQILLTEMKMQNSLSNWLWILLTWIPKCKFSCLQIQVWSEGDVVVEIRDLHLHWLTMKYEGSSLVQDFAHRRKWVSNYRACGEWTIWQGS